MRTIGYSRLAAIVLALAASCVLLAGAGPAFAGEYPPVRVPSSAKAPLAPLAPQAPTGLIFTNTHSYPFGADPTAVVIKVEVYDNFAGDFSKYHWVYRVTNNSYEPNPGTSNGFSGFELALPNSVPDIGDISAPDGIPPWLIDCCSGLPVEWDLTNSGGGPVGGGTLPGETEVYSFTTSPRLITISTGWFHTWENDGQTWIVDYAGDGPEVPDVLTEPDRELCCSRDAAGNYLCEVLVAGECAAKGGTIVVSCNDCPPPVPTLEKSWGRVKSTYR